MFIPGLSILFHWSMCLSLCQYHTVLITIALKYSLISGNVMPPALFFQGVVVAIWDPLWIHTHIKLAACSCTDAGTGCRHTQRCRSVTGVRTGSKPTNSCAGLGCWCALVWLQRLPMAICPVVVAGDARWGWWHAGAQLQRLAAHTYSSASQ